MRLSATVNSLFLALCLAPAAHAVITPLRAYELNGNYNDTYAGPAITSEGGTIGASTYTFSLNQGLTLSGAGLTSPGEYTIEMRVLLDSVQATSGGFYVKLVDFKDRTVDPGLYSYDSDGDSIDSQLTFYPAGGTVDNPIMSGAFAHIVFTRAAGTQAFHAYVDGAPAFDFIDSSSYANFSEPSQIMRFLQDDTQTSQEYTTGQIDYIRIYDVVLSPGEVAALPAVPEPATLTLALFGLAALGLVRLRRRR